MVHKSEIHLAVIDDRRETRLNRQQTTTKASKVAALPRYRPVGAGSAVTVGGRRGTPGDALELTAHSVSAPRLVGFRHTSHVAPYYYCLPKLHLLEGRGARQLVWVYRIWSKPTNRSGGL